MPLHICLGHLKARLRKDYVRKYILGSSKLLGRINSKEELCHRSISDIYTVAPLSCISTPIYHSGRWTQSLSIHFFVSTSNKLILQSFLFSSIIQTEKMVAIKNIFCFITAVTAATIYQRTPATILTDITTIDTNVNALTKAVDNYNGGFFDLLTVSSAESTLETCKFYSEVTSMNHTNNSP